MRSSFMQWKALALTAGMVLGLGACSPLLDTDSLKIDGEPTKQKDSTVDGTPYDASLLLRTLPTLQKMVTSLSTEEILALNLLWEDLPGPSANADFSINLQGQVKPLFQIFSRNGKPYACTGLEVIALVPDIHYGLKIFSTREVNSNKVHIRLFDAGSPSALLDSVVTLPRSIPAPALEFALDNQQGSTRIRMSPTPTFTNSIAAL